MSSVKPITDKGLFATFPAINQSLAKAEAAKAPIIKPDLPIKSKV